MVSGRNIIVTTTEIAAITPAIIKGSAGLIPTVNAEIAGPKKNPNPNAAPKIPNPLARDLASVVSEITAEMTGIFPAVIPSRARERKRKSALGAKAAIKNEREVPSSEITSIGLRPYLSDNLPIIGFEIKAQSEKRAKRRPF